MSYNGPPPARQPAASNDPSFAARLLQLNTLYSNPQAAPGFAAQIQSVSDPYGKSVAYDTGHQDPGRFYYGMIVDVFATANAYRVQLEKGQIPVIATAGCQTSHGFIGPSAVNTYLPGTRVLVFMHSISQHGRIIAAMPDVTTNKAGAWRTYITQASRRRVDDCHVRHIKQKNNNQIYDWNAWRPYDATAGGDWGATTTTGLAITLDDFLAQVSVNEFCGLFAFYHDSLLRIAGQSLQTWTGGHERDAYVDQAEYNDYQGYTPYPWEALGVFLPGKEVIKSYEPETFNCPTGRPYYGHWESKNTYQQPFHRTQVFYGYLGQGGRRTLQAPPKTPPEMWTYKSGPAGEEEKIFYTDTDTTDGQAVQCNKGDDKDNTAMNMQPAIGLHEDNVAQDGRRFIASAKGIVLAKRMLLPMPTRLRRPEDIDGDDAEKAYKAAGYTGSGPDHKITGDLKTDEQFGHLQRASAVLDLHGYLFNYAGLHPFHWHEKDYKVWQQSELKYAQYNQLVPSFTSLRGKMYLPQPVPIELDIDHKYKKQKFYQSEAFVSLLEDGGIVLGDGYGSEIRMVGGSITISAPGDVWLKSGKSVQLWSGADCIVRAVEDVDVSSTEKSVRIKAEQNLMMLGGNDSSEKSGGVLIESRATSPQYNFENPGDDVKFGGVVLRAPKSEVVALANNIYMRTGGGGSQTPAGTIMLDAGRGESSLVTKSSNMYNFVGQAGRIYHFFRDSTEGSVRQANLFSSDATLLSGPIGCDKDIIIGGYALVKKSVLVTDPGGHIFTGAAAKGNIYVAPCDGDCRSKAEPAIDEIRTMVEKQLPKAGDDIENSLLKQLWYANGRPGNTNTMDRMEFSFRTDDQYQISDFLLMEDRWQQLARLVNDIPKKWTERGVKTQTAAGKTWPFPGNKWLTAEGFGQVDMKIVTRSGEGLRDTDRGNQGTLSEAYSDPKFGDIKKKPINGNYPIIGRKTS